MNDEQRAALVEELAEAMFAALGPIKQEIYQEDDAILTFGEWRNMQGYESIGDDDSWALTVDKFNVLVSGAASVIDRLLAAADAPGLDADRVIRKLGSLQGQMIEVKSNINALQVETERLEDYMRNAVANAKKGAGQ